MASFTDVGDTTTLLVADKGEAVAVAISGTYNMTIKLQREIGSFGSGAWETLQTWSTEDATVAYTHVTDSYGEHLRLIVTVDTSGTATATLTNSTEEPLPYLTIRDRVGNELMTFDQGGVQVPGDFDLTGDLAVTGDVTMTGAIDAAGGVNGPIRTVTDATDTVTVADAGGTILLNRAAGIAVTLPEATGSGNKYTFVIIATFAGAAAITCEGAGVFLEGSQAILSQDGADTVVSFSSAAGDHIIDLFETGNTTGGMIGSVIELWDIGADLWAAKVVSDAGGTEATPWAT